MNLRTLFALTLAVALTACGGGGGSDNGSTPPPPPPPPPAPTATLTSSAAYAIVGTPFTLTWSSNQTACTGTNFTASAASGTVTPTLTAGTATFTVTCGTATASVTTKVLPEYTAIPDVGFQAALINLHVPVSAGQVKTADIAGITSIVMSSTQSPTMPGQASIADYSVSDLTGLANFVSLTTLYAEHQNLDNRVDFSQNPALVNLQLWDNKITHLDVSALVNLQILGTGCLDLDALDVSKNVNIVELDLQNTATCVTRARTLDLSKNVKLQRLYTQYTQLASLDLSHNPLMTDVWVSNNQLTYLNLKGVGLLKILDTRNNPGLTQILVSTLPPANQAGYLQDPGQVFVIAP